MADATPAAAPADGTAPVTTPADAVADPSKTLLTQGEPNKAADPAKPEGDKPAVAVIPDKYDFKDVKLPEGLTLSDDIVKAVEPIFKKYGLTQEAANELVTAHGEALAKVQTAAEAKRETEFKDWMKSEVTNNQVALKQQLGHRYEETISLSNKGIGAFTRAEQGYFSEAERAEFYKILDETGLGTNRLFVKVFARAGKTVQEDKPTIGQPAPGKRDAAQVLYGSTN